MLPAGKTHAGPHGHGEGNDDRKENGHRPPRGPGGKCGGRRDEEDKSGEQGEGEAVAEQ